MIKRVMVRVVLTVMCLFVWLPLFLMAGNSLMGEWEMLDRFGAVFGAANRPVKAALLPSYPTLKPYVELLLDSPGFYVMFWNSCLQTGLAVAGQLLVALPAAWAFGALSFKGRRGMFLIYIILMLQPFQVTMVPNYLVLKRLSLLNSHLAVILPAAWSAFPVFIMAKFFETIPPAAYGGCGIGRGRELDDFLENRGAPSESRASSRLWCWGFWKPGTPSNSP